jgi:AcrR family transcriptional regulator
MPRPNVSEERKQQILQAAVRVFSRQGLANTRMDDIAEAASLSKGTLYLYYKSKEDLTTAIIQQLFDPDIESLQALDTPEKSATERLYTYAQQLIDSIERFSEIYPLIVEFYASALRESSHRELLNRYFAHYRESLAGIIAQGTATGEFKPVDPHQTATTLTALFEGTALLSILNTASFDFRTQCMANLRLLMSAIA